MTENSFLSTYFSTFYTVNVTAYKPMVLYLLEKDKNLNRHFVHVQLYEPHLQANDSFILNFLIENGL